MEEGFYYKNDYLKKRNKRYISALLENTLTQKSIIFHEMLIPAKKKKLPLDHMESGCPYLNYCVPHFGTELIM